MAAVLKRVYIEILNRCNLHCSFCSPATRPARTMSIAEFDRLAAAIKPHCDYIYLHVKGEPLLHPELPAILQCAADRQLQVNLTTNGLLLPQYAALLADSPALRQVNLSLHGYTAATHGDLATWLDKLCSFAKVAAARGKFTVFRFWTLDKLHTPDPDGLLILALLAQRFGYPDNLAVVAAKKRSVTLMPHIFVSFEQQFEWPSLQNRDYGECGSCYGSRTMVGILADGTVVPCCLDSEGVCALGNALVTPLCDILQGDRRAAMSAAFANRQVAEPICRHCGYRTRFGTGPNPMPDSNFEGDICV